MRLWGVLRPRRLSPWPGEGPGGAGYGKPASPTERHRANGSLGCERGLRSLVGLSTETPPLHGGTYCWLLPLTFPRSRKITIRDDCSQDNGTMSSQPQSSLPYRLTLRSLFEQVFTECPHGGRRMSRTSSVKSERNKSGSPPACYISQRAVVTEAEGGSGPGFTRALCLSRAGRALRNPPCPGRRPGHPPGQRLRAKDKEMAFHETLAVSGT